MSRTTRHRRTAVTLAAATLLPLAGCAVDGTPATHVVWQTATPAASGGAEAGPGRGRVDRITAACPLVDERTVAATFGVGRVRERERTPRQAVPGVRTYACELFAGADLVLTVAVAVGPASGTAEANVRAALIERPGEPVAGVGDAAGYDRDDGTGTVAAAFRRDGQMRVLLVSGAGAEKEQLVRIARAVAPRI